MSFIDSKCFVFIYRKTLSMAGIYIGYNLNARTHTMKGAQWLSGRVLDSRPKGRGFEPHRRHCVVSLSKNINPSLVMVQPRRTCPFITERLLIGRKESNQTKKLRQIQEGLLSLTSESMCRKYWLAA